MLGVRIRRAPERSDAAAVAVSERTPVGADVEPSSWLAAVHPVTARLALVDDGREAMGGGDPAGFASGAAGKAPRGDDALSLSRRMSAAAARVASRASSEIRSRQSGQSSR